MIWQRWDGEGGGGAGRGRLRSQNACYKVVLLSRDLRAQPAKSHKSCDIGEDSSKKSEGSNATVMCPGSRGGVWDLSGLL